MLRRLSNALAEALYSLAEWLQDRAESLADRLEDFADRLPGPEADTDPLSRELKQD
jgi:hypothetical protein